MKITIAELMDEYEEQECEREHEKQERLAMYGCRYCQTAGEVGDHRVDCKCACHMFPYKYTS